MKFLTFKEFRKKNSKRAKEFHGEDIWSETDWGCALAGEVGELCNFIKKRRRRKFKGSDYLVDIKKEIGDIATYLDLVANVYGFTLESCIVDKFNEVSKRRGSKIKL